MRISLTWDDVYERLAGAPEGKLWGVPRGGQIVAGLTGRAVDHPEAADVIVDDLIDSGLTRERYRAQFPAKPFWTLMGETAAGDWVVFPWEQDETPAADGVLRLLQALGEDVKRDGLRDTPRRVARALDEMTIGRLQDPAAYLEVTFEDPCPVPQLITVRALPFVSLCEHHLMPFWGTCDLSYVSRPGRVVGLSKLPRMLRALSRRLQTQERLTWEVARTLYDSPLKPLGVEVRVRSHHSCMQLRGVESPGEMETCARLGEITA